MNNIYLVGFMGTGKTSVGEGLAKKMKRRFIDLDDLIELKERRRICDIFAQEGEPYFRRSEHEALKEVAREKDFIVACGGGIVVNRDNIKIMKETGRIICLRASLPVILKRIRGASHRPLLNVKDQQEQIKCLLKMRAPFYASADRSIDTSRLSIDEVISRVSRLTGEKKNKPGRGNRKPAPKRKAKVKKI